MLQTFKLMNKLKSTQLLNEDGAFAVRDKTKQNMSWDKSDSVQRAGIGWFPFSPWSAPSSESGP
jgi:hypothetical protein